MFEINFTNSDLPTNPGFSAAQNSKERAVDSLNTPEIANTLKKLFKSMWSFKINDCHVF